MMIPARPALAGVGASNPNSPPPPPPVVSADGEIVVRVNYTDVVYTIGGSGGPVCTWRHFTTGEYEAYFDLTVDVDPPPLPDVPDLPVDREVTPEERAEHDRAVEARAAEERQRRIDAERERRRKAAPSLIPLTELGTVVDHRVFAAECPSGFSVRFIAVTTDEGDLLQNVMGIAQDRIPDATPDISPPIDVGGVVNLGLWLAIEPPPAVPNITAEAGPVWATVSPRHVATEFDFGDGTSISCDGIGDPIENSHPDLDVVEPSPVCGHVYRRSSPDDQPYRLEIGSVWSLAYTTSAGVGSPIESFTRRTVVPYDVDEIQTIGSR